MVKGEDHRNSERENGLNISSADIDSTHRVGASSPHPLPPPHLNSHVKLDLFLLLLYDTTTGEKSTLIKNY